MVGGIACGIAYGIYHFMIKTPQPTLPGPPALPSPPALPGPSAPTVGINTINVKGVVGNVSLSI
jgi:hypothetical protein